jgi:GNAT superfamily N-acetyltransferase
MLNTRLVFVEAELASAEAEALLSASESELRKRYPGMQIHGIEPAEFCRDGGVFLIGKLDGAPVACGALRPMSDGAGELKRMFVREGERGRGFGRAILAELERIATRCGYQTIRLGTGTNQPEAIRLYESAGYYPIPCFEEYIQDERSRCFEKSLDPNPGRESSARVNIAR